MSVMWGVHSDKPQLDLVGNGVIAIGWDEMGDLSALPNDQEAIKARVAETYPDWTPPMVAGAAGTLLSFRHRMQVGDFLVYPYKPDGTLNFGRIDGDYFYDSSASLHRNRRRIDWLRVGIPRTGFSQAARNEMGSAITVFRVRNHEREFADFIASGELPDIREDNAGAAELRTVWESGSWRAQRAGASAERSAALPVLQALIHRFVSGESDLRGFQQESQDFSVAEPHWGFKGFGQMLLNQVAKVAELSGKVDHVTAELRQIVAAPADEAAAEVALGSFVALLTELSADAERLGVGKPAPGRAPLVASYFWEAQSREDWPVFYPKSREELARRGLFHHPENPVAAYRAFRSAIFALRDALGADVWDIESLLWNLPRVEKAVPPPVTGDRLEMREPAIDIYEEYRGAKLYFPDAVVTTLLLSLWAKPFVILSGISGTGKTKIALGLAQALEPLSVRATPTREVAQVPVEDEENAYLPITRAARERGRFYINVTQSLAFDLPERGHSVKIPVRLPDGRDVAFRLNNIDLTAGGSRRLLLFADAPAREWLHDATDTGDALHLAFDHRPGATAHVLPGAEEAAAAGHARHEVVPVRADWNDTRGLLGFWNPLTTEYERAPFLDLALRALNDPERPYFAILDEMNLARVEYYFSDVLSAMESGEPIPLRGQGDDEGDEEVPSRLDWPANLYVIGTVNVDETTHAFSPKVLDRASVIEFDEVDIGRALGGGDESTGDDFKLIDPMIDVSMFGRSGAFNAEMLRERFPAFNDHLAQLHGVLATDRLHFGYRVINEIVAFVGLAIEHAGATAGSTALDYAFCQKVLPKLSGGREIEVPLQRVLDFMLDPARAGGDSYRDAFERWKRDGTEGSVYPRAAAKTARMIQRLADTGFVSALE